MGLFIEGFFIFGIIKWGCKFLICLSFCVILFFFCIRGINFFVEVDNLNEIIGSCIFVDLGFFIVFLFFIFSRLEEFWEE